jgi:hypothetical protein
MTSTYTEFAAHGPFRVRKELLTDPPRRTIKGFWRDGFWKTDPELASLANRCGCYVFAVRRGKAITPHYLGLTTKRFDREVFNPANVRKYRNALRERRRGYPVLFIVAHPTRTQINTKNIAEVEDFLIQTASVRNPAVQNVKGVRRPKWLIRGIVRSTPGKPTWAARQLRSTLSLRPVEVANKRMQPTARRVRRG